ERNVAKFDLNLALIESAQGLAGGVGYDMQLFTPATVRRLIGHFVSTLERIVREGGKRIGEMSVLEEGERRQVVEEWSGREVEVPGECVHELFSMEAQRRPEAVALVYEGREVKYGELERRSNQLGHYLRGIG